MSLTSVCIDSVWSLKLLHLLGGIRYITLGLIPNYSERLTSEQCELFIFLEVYNLWVIYFVYFLSIHQVNSAKNNEKKSLKKDHLGQKSDASDFFS